MKELLTVVSLLVVGVVGQYPSSGWRPDGPAFELPQKVPQKQEYLPPVDPRNPPSDSYGPPEVDVSVQGLPTEEPQPLFRVSPINGQQYVGPSFNADVKRLDERLRQSQYQAQQERYRQLARQRQLEAQANANQPSFQVPSQFVPRTTAKPTQATTKADESRTTAVETTAVPLDLNQGEVLDKSEKKEKVTVEVTKQRIQAFPAELFLTPLAQLNLQSQQQYAPVQLGQIRAPVYFQPAQGVPQKQVAGYDGATHFAALPSVLAQQQLLQAQLVSQQQNQGLNPYVIPQQQAFVQNEQSVLPANQYEIQPVQPQIQAQPVVFQSQLNQIQPMNTYGQPQKTNSEDDDEQVQSVQPVQPQIVYQQPFPQVQQVNPQGQESYPQVQQVYPQTQQVYPQTQQGYPQTQQIYPQTQQIYPQTQQIYPQTQQVNPQQYPQQYYPQQVISQAQQPYPQYQPSQYSLFQTQLSPSDYQLYQQRNQQPQDGSLQSGLDVNMQGNGVDQNENKDGNDDDDERTTVTATATAFGTRTQPRVAYGVPVPRAQANPGYQTTAESNQDEGSDDAAAEATAAARGNRRKNAKLRSRRVRPVFTLDKSGHLVLAEQQN